jgi:hypothetical protein
VANTFNSVLRKIIFQELRATCGDIIQFIPFVHAFYAFEYPLFYNHHNCEGDVTIIPFAMGIRHGDPWGGGGGGTIPLTHFRVINFIANHFPFCLFSSIADDIHIIGPPSIVSSTYEHF